MDAPPGTTPSVWQALRAANATGVRVTLTLRAPPGGDATHETVGRTLTGQIARLDRTRDGRTIVVLAVSNETEQRVLVERIARVRAATSVSG